MFFKYGLFYKLILLSVGDTYVDAGATARKLNQNQCIDTDATQLIMIENSVDTVVAGDYIVSYTVLDIYNPTYNQTLTRDVHVIGDTIPGGGNEWEPVEFTSKNSSHKRASRAVKVWGSYYAVGSNAYLGSWRNVTTLCESYEGYYDLSSCD